MPEATKLPVMTTTTNSRALAPDEAMMRAEPGKRRRYEKLLDRDLFTEVVEANRAYLTAAVPNAADTERDHWALSCLPGTTPYRLSAVSMRSMETFALFEAQFGGGDGVVGFVIVARSVLEAGFGSVNRFTTDFPELEVETSNYRDAGDDQLRVLGGRRDLVAALWHGRFGAAAEALAERLMHKKTMQWRGHSYLLADHVLGRA